MWKDQQTPPETIWCPRPRQTTVWTKMGHQMNLGGVHFISQTQNSSSSSVCLVHGARWLGTALNGGVIAAPGLPAGRHPDCALHTETPFKCRNRIISGTSGSTGKWCSLLTDSFTKNDNSIIIYSSSSCAKPKMHCSHRTTKEESEPHIKDKH